MCRRLISRIAVVTNGTLSFYENAPPQCAPAARRQPEGDRRHDSRQADQHGSPDQQPGGGRLLDRGSRLAGVSLLRNPRLQDRFAWVARGRLRYQRRGRLARRRRWVPGVGAFETGVGAGEGAWATGTEGTDAEASSTAAWGVCVESTVAARSDWVAAGETTVSGDAEDVASADGGGAEGVAFGAAGMGVLVKARVAVGGSPAAAPPLEGGVGVAVALPATAEAPLTLTSPLANVTGIRSPSRVVSKPLVTSNGLAPPAAPPETG